MTAFHCDICGSASHDAIVCKPNPWLVISPDNPAYMSIQRFLDKVLGENEDDGAGYGIEGDIRLAVAMAWEQGYLRGVLDSEGDLERADNPYAEDVPA